MPSVCGFCGGRRVKKHCRPGCVGSNPTRVSLVTQVAKGRKCLSSILICRKRQKPEKSKLFHHSVRTAPVLRAAGMKIRPCAEGIPREIADGPDVRVPPVAGRAQPKPAAFIGRHVNKGTAPFVIMEEKMKTIIFEDMRGALIEGGKFKKLLGPGKYRTMGAKKSSFFRSGKRCLRAPKGFPSRLP